jgi:hypothetical protein
MQQPNWREIPQFVPMSRKHYEKMYHQSSGGKQQPQQQQQLRDVQTPSVNTTTGTRLKLTHLLHCLAISETQRKQLESHLEAVTRQKEDLNNQLNRALQEQQELLRREQSKKIYMYIDSL